MRRFLKLSGAALGVVVLVLLLVLAGFRWQADRREITPAAQLAPPGGRLVQAGDVMVFVQEAGPRDGPAVLFVHGTGAWSETWRESMQTLAQAGFHAIAMDLPPFGFSNRPTTARYGRRDQAARIIGVLDALKLDRATLVGHSFGGGPTVEAAFLAPQRVRALVLVDVALGLDMAVPAADGSATNGSPPIVAPAPAPSIVERALGVQPLRDAVVATFLTNPLFTKKLLGMFIADPVHATPERVLTYQKPLGVAGSTPAIGAWLPSLFKVERDAASANPAAYAGLKMPVKIIWGSLDTITPQAQGEHLALLVPGAELLLMPNVGHIPQIEDATEFNALLLKVFGSLKALP
jgi:pimeloyl-ACP methyl ester carboxylesterase